MPFKFNQARRRHFNSSSSSHVPRDWASYNRQLKQRGDITVWFSDDAIDTWYQPDRTYDGTGAPRLYSDTAILTTHEVRQVFKLPLRQCQGFMNSLFALLGIDLQSPDYSTLSRRLKQLGIRRPFYRYPCRGSCDYKMIAIDSTGLKCFDHDDWFNEKYGENQRKRNWRKLHIAVDGHQIIQASELTQRKVQDAQAVPSLINPMDGKVKHITADAAYDTNNVYASLHNKFSSADIVIPPQKNAVVSEVNDFYRNRNLLEIQVYGKQEWQRRRSYGRRNSSESAFGRYKRILGSKLHSRDFERQQQETMIGCSILNKMTCLNLAAIRQKN